MLGINWTLGRIVATIATFMGIGTLVSCYGVPVDDIYEEVMYGMPPNYGYEVAGQVVGDIDGDGSDEGVPGIQYQIKKSGQIEAIKTGKTSDEGYFAYSNIKTAGNYTLVFEDVDGEENGSFNSKEEMITLPNTTADNINMRIKLEKK